MPDIPRFVGQILRAWGAPILVRVAQILGLRADPQEARHAPTKPHPVRVKIDGPPRA